MLLLNKCLLQAQLCTLQQSLDWPACDTVWQCHPVDLHLSMNATSVIEPSMQPSISSIETVVLSFRSAPSVTRTSYRNAASRSACSTSRRPGSACTSCIKWALSCSILLKVCWRTLITPVHPEWFSHELSVQELNELVRISQRHHFAVCCLFLLLFCRTFCKIGSVRKSASWDLQCFCITVAAGKRDDEQ
jgi:hypothetical protein